MQELELKIKQNESEIARVNENVQLTNNLLSEIKAITEKMNCNFADIKQENLSLKEDIKKSNDFRVILPDYLPWVGSMLLFVILSFLLKDSPEWLKSGLAFITSWLTTITILVCGIVAANAVKPYSRFVSALVGAGYAAIFTAYLLYITIDLGAIDANVAAFGFNIGSILQSVVSLVAILTVTGAMVIKKWQLKK